jgi:hypothetical protein
LAAANTAGSTKKAITSGAIFIGRSNERYCISALILRGYNVGNIAAAYLVFNEERPIKYRSTWISVLVGMVFTIFASLFLRYWYIRENKRRDTADAAATLQSAPISRAGSHDKLHEASDSVERENRIVERLDDYQDLTDKQRRDFRYVY